MTTLARRRFLHLAGLAAATTAVPVRLAYAQAWPTRPIRWLVGFPAGGSTDIVMRIMGAFLAERLGQPVVIENRPGAATNLATQAALSAPPDGHTLLLALVTNAINATLYETLPFNFLNDAAPVGGFVDLPLVLVVNPSVPAKTLAEFVAFAKANPDKVNLGSFGTGTVSHLAVELFKMTTGVRTVHVPYRGGAPLMTDLIAGQVQAGIDALPNVLPHIQRGTARALAVLPATRSEALPDVPTAAETIPGFEVSTWSGIVVPKGTPDDVIERLNRELNAGLADPGIRKRFAEIGAQVIGSSPAAFGALMTRETEKWAKVIKSSGVRPE
jgi:tripartite-type tricarboxylate transporter receptor subunit TctC